MRLLDEDEDEDGGSGNPMVPDSVPALLAEEWMIHPYSTLPSFLELMMMQDADRSVAKASRTALDAVTERLRAYLQSSNSNPEEDADPTSSTASAALLAAVRRLIRRWVFRMAYALESVLERNGAEIRCLLRYYLERRFLQSQRCTIAESFYGTVRVRAAAQPDDQGQTKLMPLRTLDQTRLALFLALGPYLKERLREWHNRWGEQEEQWQTSQEYYSADRLRRRTDSAVLLLLLRLQRKLRQYFVRFYPIILASVQASNVYCQWRYLIGFSHFVDLRNTLLGQVIRRRTQQDSADADAAVDGKTVSNNNGASATSADRVQGVGSDSPKTKTALQSTILYLVATAVTVSWVTQLRFWYVQRHRERLEQQLQRQQESSTTGSNEMSLHHHSSLAGIPPQPLLRPQDARAVPDGCPLCGRRSRILPTACAPSGLVYCLACIRPFVQEHGTCPVTGKPVSESQLVRLFEPTTELLERQQ